MIVLASILGRHSTSSTGSNVTSTAPSTTPSQPQIPSLQQTFVSIVSAAQSQSRSAANDMQRGGVKANRDQSLCAQFQSLDVTEWVGTVRTIDSNSDGKGVLAVDIAPRITLKTWNNSLSDVTSNTLIEPGSPLFQAASAMKRGQKVRFSGTFLAGGSSDGGDCLKEASLTLRGKFIG